MKKNKLVALALVLGMMLVPSFNAVAAEYEAADIYITLDGLLHRTEIQPVIVDGYTMVSLREISELLGATVEWESSSQKVTVKMKAGRFIEMKAGDKSAIVDYMKAEMPVAPVIVNDRVMVPLRFICEKYNLNVNWDEGKHIVALSTGKQKYSVLEARHEADLGDDGVELTFNEAVKQINNNSASLKNITDSLVVMKRNKKDLDDFIKDNVGSIANGLSKVYTYEEIEYFRKQRTLNNQIKSTELNESLIKEGYILSLQNALTEIEKADLDIYLLEEKIKLDETNLENMQLKLSLGLETESNVRSLENSIAKNKISLNLLEIKQNNNNLDLNKLLGVDASKKVKITDFDSEASAYQNDVDLFVKDQLKNSNAIKLKEVDLDNATWTKTTYYELLLQYLREEKTDDNEDPISVIEMDNNVAKAQRALDDAKLSLENTIRTSYNSIKQLEQSYDSLVVDYEIAKDNYEQVVINYVTGYATAFDVQQTQYGLLKAEADLLTNRINYRIAVESYNSPRLPTQQ